MIVNKYVRFISHNGYVYNFIIYVTLKIKFCSFNYK